MDCDPDARVAALVALYGAPTAPAYTQETARLNHLRLRTGLGYAAAKRLLAELDALTN